MFHDVPQKGQEMAHHFIAVVTPLKSVSNRSHSGPEQLSTSEPQTQTQARANHCQRAAEACFEANSALQNLSHPE